MKALSALRQVFSLKKNEELGRKFSPEELKRIVDAMKEYAASKLQEQRAICQREFELAYDSGESNLGTRVKPLNLIDYGKDKQLFTFLDATGENALF